MQKKMAFREKCSLEKVPRQYPKPKNIRSNETKRRCAHHFPETVFLPPGGPLGVTGFAHDTRSTASAPKGWDPSLHDLPEQNAPRSSGSCRVFVGADEVQGNVGLVPHDPAIVTRSDHEAVPLA